MTANTQIDLNEMFTIKESGVFTVLEYKNPKNKLVIYDPGLAHTATCKSEICKIDKSDGKLYYRGISAVERTKNDFLDVAFDIIFNGDQSERGQFKGFIQKHFKLLEEQKNLLDVLPMSTHPMHVLSIASTALAGIESKYLSDTQNPLEIAAFLVAQVAVTIAYRFNKMQATEWIQPNFDLPYAEMVLNQMHGGKNKERCKKLGEVLNKIMILHAEHGQNCSAVTVRDIASARGSIYTGVAGGMSAFNGTLHGGASQFVSEMYEELLASGLDVNTYVQNKLDNGEVLMGFGQRTYNRIPGCWDPRVETMYATLMDPEFDFPEIDGYKRAAQALIDRVIEDPFFKRRNLTPNPDLFNCIFYKLFGVPPEMNTTMLALGRISGWVANFMEHTSHGYPLSRPCDLEAE